MASKVCGVNTVLLKDLTYLNCYNRFKCQEEPHTLPKLLNAIKWSSHKDVAQVCTCICCSVSMYYSMYVYVCVAFLVVFSLCIGICVYIPTLCVLCMYVCVVCMFIVFWVGESKQKLYCIFHTGVGVLYENTVYVVTNTAQWAVQKCQKSN